MRLGHELFLGGDLGVSWQLGHFESSQSLAEVVNIDSSISVHVQFPKQLFQPVLVCREAGMRTTMSGRFVSHNAGLKSAGCLLREFPHASCSRQAEMPI